MKNEIQTITMTMVETPQGLGATATYKGQLTVGTILRGIHALMTDVTQRTNLNFEQILEAVVDIELHTGNVSKLEVSGDLTDEEIKERILALSSEPKDKE